MSTFISEQDDLQDKENWPRVGPAYACPAYTFNIPMGWRDGGMEKKGMSNDHAPLNSVLSLPLCLSLYLSLTSAHTLWLLSKNKNKNKNKKEEKERKLAYIPDPSKHC